MHRSTNLLFLRTCTSFFLTNHGSFILIFFGKAPSPTALVEFITINEEDEGEELVKDLASFHIESASPEM